LRKKKQFPAVLSSADSSLIELRHSTPKAVNTAKNRRKCPTGILNRPATSPLALAFHESILRVDGVFAQNFLDRV